ncbi:QWRF motif-containing protein 2-like isoform X2 [Magnolia sinica]|uniref:QWRF motif-containing protein 2-like isoform X2 n=1 Tax=Magnolia sinica TaxID=86752 RepID=UPI00265950F8|nr:QWRF motif-containing protein 2-like isoform X2 [Magnolia sinica]
MVAAAIPTTPSHHKRPFRHHHPHHQNPPTPNRTPLLPSEIDNGFSTAPPPSTRPNSKFAPSRYLSSSSSSSSSRRFPSPLISRPAAQPSVPKRSLSVERRRPTTPLPDSKHCSAVEVSAATKVLRTSSRSLSVSFQGESFSLPISKVKPAPALTPLPQPNSRKSTPERRRLTTVPVRREQLENSKPVDQQRWPAKNRQPDPLTRNLDCGNEKKIGMGSPQSAIRATLQQSVVDDGRRVSFDGRIRSDLCNSDLDNGSAVACDLTASDTDSVSSGSNSGLHEFSATTRGRATPRGISIPARFLQEANAQLRRSQEPGSPLSRAISQPKLIPSKRAVTDSPIMSPRMTSQTQSSPLRGPVRAPSPSKLLLSSPSTLVSSPSRGMPSPSWMRNSSVSSQPSSNTLSILSFAADIRRAKMGENRIEDAHLLRLSYNRNLQWRFVNARADAAILVQRLTAELSYLEEWAVLDRDHSSSLSGAIEALKASTLRLPVIGGARADIRRMKDAVCSAVDVMQAMGSSICSLVSKLEGMSSLVAELTNVVTQEQALLAQCKHLLSTIAAMQVEECSLRTHLLQLRRRSNLTQA